MARIHDAFFAELAEAAARMVLGSHPPGRALDMGCGSGVFGEALSDAGWEVAGFDVSPAMVRLAQKRVPTCRFWVDDVRDAHLGSSWDVVTAIGEVLAYGCDASAIKRVFARVHAALRPGGTFLSDLPTPGRAMPPTSGERVLGPWRLRVATHEEGGILHRHLVAEGPERVEESHAQHLHEVEDVLAWLDDAGFEAEWIGGYDDYAFQPGWDGFLATR